MRNKSKRQSKLHSKRFWLASLVVAVILGSGGAFAYGSYINAHQPEPPKLSKANVSGVKKTPKEKLSYDVPTNNPRNLIIDKLGISANVQPMGILQNGALEAPKTAWDVGWYKQSALPGSDENALLIDGHVNDALNSPGVFYHIDTLKAGDQMKIERGDRQMFTYKVVKVDQKPLEQVDMAGMLKSISSGKEGLNLITCGGVYDYKRQTYNDRILVYSERIS
ncbi:MAG: Sortase family enzyme [Candidatus Saccharibacteria bacterium]|nr:Sortase family enzyme [Candidatus Saccharibacteria bacterium]